MFEVCESEGKTKVAWILSSANKLERKFKFAGGLDAVRRQVLFL